MISIGKWALKGKLLVGAVGIAFLVGSIGGGLLVRKVMDGTIARKQLKAEKLNVEKWRQVNTENEATIIKERALRELAEQSEARIQVQLGKSDERYSRLIADTSDALARIPKDTVRYVNEGKKIGDDLINKDPGNAWIRNVWDDSMYDLAFCSGAVGTANGEICGMYLAGPVQSGLNP